MPTYDYECDACGHSFELFQSITADPETKCPECKKKKLRRLIGTGAAVMFKGSGFYTTDYRSDSYKKSAAADSKPASTGGGEAKPDSASKSESKSSDKPATEKSGSDKPTSNKPASDKPSVSKGSKKKAE